LCPKNIYSFFIKLFYFILEVASIDHETYFSIPVIITISVSRKKIYTNVINNWGIIYKYIVFGRGICGKYKSRDEKLPLHSNTKIWISWSKEKKEIFNSRRRRIISKNTYKLLLLKPLRIFILEIYRSQAYYIPA
jgi:hypothetical protein